MFIRAILEQSAAFASPGRLLNELCLRVKCVPGEPVQANRLESLAVTLQADCAIIMQGDDMLCAIEVVFVPRVLLQQRLGIGDRAAVDIEAEYDRLVADLEPCEIAR